MTGVFYFSFCLVVENHLEDKPSGGLLLNDRLADKLAGFRNGFRFGGKGSKVGDLHGFRLGEFLF